MLQPKPVIFWRWTREENYVSLFVMEGRLNSAIVDVYFDREIDKLAVDSVCILHSDLLSQLLRRKSGTVVTFLDGPNHTDGVKCNLHGTYDFFCTSGGFPPLSNAGVGLTKVWTLGGWEQDDMAQALVQILHVSLSGAIALYELSGGCIRLTTRQNREGILKHFNDLINVIPVGAISVAIFSNQRLVGPNSYDRLRMMFEAKDGGVALQVIDSRYVLRMLRGRLTDSEFYSAYLLAASVKLGSPSGGLFEEIMHRWFRQAKPGPIERCVWSNGSSAEGVQELTSKNVYWIPSVCNFPNIDAAVVCGDTLECFHYTVSSYHVFDETSFWMPFSLFVPGCPTHPSLLCRATECQLRRSFYCPSAALSLQFGIDKH
jgi:hypothetical protein